MTAAPRARAPRRPMLEPADDATIEAVVHHARQAFDKVRSLRDGSLTLTRVAVAAEFARVCQPIEDAEVAAAAAVAELVAS